MFTKRAHRTDKFDNLIKETQKGKTVLISKVQGEKKAIYYADLEFLLF